MRMEQTELAGGTVKVTLTGPLDLTGAADIDKPLGIISGKYTKVIVDLTNVPFLASIGVRVLLKTARAIGSRNGRLVVFNANDDARKVLRSTGVDTVITVAADEGAALAACT
jgi:anti-sigma B factor antagonist